MLALLQAAALIQEPIARGVSAEESKVLSSTYARRHALVIGIDQYEDPAFPDLTYAIADAKAVAKLLIERHGFAEEDVLLLVNATEEDIDRSLADWACDSRRIGPEDLLVVFYAGHGYNRLLEHGVRAYFVPSDAASRDGIPLWSTLVGMDTVQAASETIPAKHAVFILDCCFGGWLTTRAPLSTQPGLTSVARQVLTAGNENQWVLDSGGDGHSVFAQALLDALDGKADVDANGAISFGELYEYVHKTVQEQAALLEQSQTPSMATLSGHRGGSAAFFLDHGLSATAPETSTPYSDAVVAFLNFAMNPVLGREQAQAALNIWREAILRGEAPQELVESALQAVCLAEVDIPSRLFAGADDQWRVSFSHRGGLGPSTLVFSLTSLTVDAEERLEQCGRGYYGYSGDTELHEAVCRTQYSFESPETVGAHEVHLTIGIDIFDGNLYGDGCGGLLRDGSSPEPIYRTQRRLGPYLLQVDPIEHMKVEGEHLAELIRKVLDLRKLEVSFTPDENPLLKATFFIKKGSRQPVAVTGVIRVHLEPWAEMEVPFYSWIRDDNFDPGRDIGGCPLRGSARSAQSSSGSEGWQVTITLGGAQTVVVNREAWLACAGAEHTLVVEIISDESYVDQLSECFGQSLYWQGKIQYEVPVIIK